MAVRLRLRRTGARKKACFRVVAADQRSPRDGRFIEVLGLYDPRHESERLNMERVDYWLSNGAQPSRTVADIIRRVRAGISTKPAAASEAAAVDAGAPATDDTNADVEVPPSVTDAGDDTDVADTDKDTSAAEASDASGANETAQTEEAAAADDGEEKA